MSRYYDGPKPCPGCGKPGTEVRRDSVAGICHRCEGLLRVGQEAIDAAGRKTGRQETVHFMFCGLPQYTTSGYFPVEHHENPSVQKAIVNLLTGLDLGFVPDAPTVRFGGREGSYGHVWATVYVPRALAEDVIALVAAVGEYARVHGEEMKDRGQGLIQQLATGELTLADFEDQAARRR